MKLKSVVLLFFSFVLFQAMGQEKVYSFELKKGDVLDVMLLTQLKADNAGELFNTYKKTIFPVGVEYSYQPLSGFGISKLTLGTNNANAFLFSKWDSLEKREGFLDIIVDRVPNFHQQRRVLFPDFRLTYYEMNKDLKFSVNTSKYNVVTALWTHTSKKDSLFFKKWEDAVLKFDGKVIVTLQNGKSPLGYYYNADILCVVEWQNEDAFDKFDQKHPLSFYEELRNVHQFVIQ